MKLTPKGKTWGTYAEFKAHGWTDEQLVVAGYAVAPEVTNEQSEHARSIVENIIRFYREKGFVITVEQAPLQPLAMGNHTDVVSVRPVRK